MDSINKKNVEQTTESHEIHCKPLKVDEVIMTSDSLDSVVNLPRQVEKISLLMVEKNTN